MSTIFPQITGLGLITPLGANCEENFHSLLTGQFITQPSRAKFPEQQGNCSAEIFNRIREPNCSMGVSPMVHGRDARATRADSDKAQGGNIHELALAAARQAMAHAGWKYWPDDAAIIAATSKGDIESWLAAIENHQQHRAADYPWQDRLGLGDLASTLAENIRARDSIRLTYSAACASALHALAKAVMMIQAGEVSKALVVAAESSLHPLFQGCFQNLGVSAPIGQPSRPFDLNRHGFHISQAAAAICVEAPFTGKSPIAPVAQIDHIALAGDAYHLTAADPDGKTLRRLLSAALANGIPDLIHAHATGTPANDAVELAGIESALDLKFLNSSHAGSEVPRRPGFTPNQFEKLKDVETPLPILYSHKAALGHSLGASGLISIVINCLIHHHNQIPGNICTINPLPVEKVILATQPISRQVQRSLVLASGFGGASAIVGLRSA